jgi:hypothetical protein
LKANYAAKKAQMIKEGDPNPTPKAVQVAVLEDYKLMKNATITIEAKAADNIFNHGGGVGGRGSGGGGGGGDGGSGGGASGSVDGARDERGHKEKKNLKRKLREAEEWARLLAAQLNAAVSAAGAGSAAQTVDTQARAGAQDSAQRADHVSDIPGSSTVLSPSPPDSVKKLKRSIAGLNRAADYHKDPATLQRLGELEYELDERKRKKQKSGTW